MALKKRKLTKALFNTLSNPLSGNSENLNGRKFDLWKRHFSSKRKNVGYMPCHTCICISVLIS